MLSAFLSNNTVFFHKIIQNSCFYTIFIFYLLIYFVFYDKIIQKYIFYEVFIMKSTSNLSKQISEKTIRAQGIAIFVVCIIFGIANFVRGTVAVGIATISFGTLVPAIAIFAMKNVSKMTRGIVLTQGTTLIIIILGSTLGELHSLYTLLLASVAVGGLYYSVANVNTSWIVINVATIGALFFKDFFYKDVDMVILIKGIIGINVGIFMIRLLIITSINNAKKIETGAAETEQLLGQVKARMEETEQLSAKRSEVMQNVSDIAEQLDSSSRSMLDISGRLSSASEEQSTAISDIYSSVEMITSSMESSMEAASKAASAAEKSADMLNENNADMHKMVEAMGDISESSRKISTIIQTIEDISFQTNILALNAAVEAARAGEAGKGFAVVADEVRNLANRSAQATKNTTALINESIRAVETGTNYARTAAEKMDSIIEFSAESKNHAHAIERMAEEQQKSVEVLRQRISEISDVIANNSATAEECNATAQGVSAEVEKMNAIVSAN